MAPSDWRYSVLCGDAAVTTGEKPESLANWIAVYRVASQQECKVKNLLDTPYWPSEHPHAIMRIRWPEYLPNPPSASNEAVKPNRGAPVYR